MAETMSASFKSPGVYEGQLAANRLVRGPRVANPSGNPFLSDPFGRALAGAGAGRGDLSVLDWRSARTKVVATILVATSGPLRKPPTFAFHYPCSPGCEIIRPRGGRTRT